MIIPNTVTFGENFGVKEYDSFFVNSYSDMKSSILLIFLFCFHILAILFNSLNAGVLNTVKARLHHCIPFHWINTGKGPKEWFVGGAIGNTMESNSLKLSKLFTLFFSMVLIYLCDDQNELPEKLFVCTV